MKYFEKLFIRDYEDIIINAPIQIMESTIIKDTVDNIIYLRNIFTNVGKDVVIAIVLEGTMFDITGEKIQDNNGIFNYTYQDIEVNPNDIFGNKIPIELPKNVRKIDITIKKIVLKSGMVIGYSDMERIVPEKPNYIDIPIEFLNKKIVNGVIPEIYPIINNNYWQCTCGRINWNDERTCGNCKRTIEEQKSYEEVTIRKEFEEFTELKNKERKEAEEREIELRKKEKEKREKELEEERIRLKKEEETRIKKNKKNKKILSIVGAILVAIIVILIIIFGVIPSIKYNNAMKLKKSGKYDQAIEAFEKLDKEQYKEEIEDCKRLYANELLNKEEFDEAREVLLSIEDIVDNSDEIKDCDYKKALYYMSEKEYEKAKEIFDGMKGYLDCSDLSDECVYLYATELYEEGKYEESEKLFSSIKSYKDSSHMSNVAKRENDYNSALEYYNDGRYYNALLIFTELDGYKDSISYINDNIDNVCEMLVHNGNYSECVELCAKAKVENEYYYESSYVLGNNAFEEGDYVSAKLYFSNCNNYLDDVETKLNDCDNYIIYDKAKTFAIAGSIDKAISEFEKIQNFNDASSWLSKCRTAYSYMGDFYSDSYTISQDGETYVVSDDSKMRITARFDEEMNIYYGVNSYMSGEKNSTVIKYNTTSDLDIYADIVAKKITKTYYDNDGTVSATYVYVYH